MISFSLKKMFFLRNNVIKFALGPKLLPKPARRVEHEHEIGHCCFRAVCFLEGPATARVTITGYDKSIHIVEEVEDACRLHAAAVPGSTCAPPELTMLPPSSRTCSGQVYFAFEMKKKM